VLFRKEGILTEEEAMKIVEWMSLHPKEKELIVMAEAVEDAAKRRLWDYARAVKLMADMTGEEREVRVEILEGFVSERVKGINVDEL
jgi:hypothetical protein